MKYLVKHKAKAAYKYFKSNAKKISKIFSLGEQFWEIISSPEMEEVFYVIITSPVFEIQLTLWTIKC